MFHQTSMTIVTISMQSLTLKTLAHSNNLLAMINCDVRLLFIVSIVLICRDSTSVRVIALGGLNCNLDGNCKQLNDVKYEKVPIVQESFSQPSMIGILQNVQQNKLDNALVRADDAVYEAANNRSIYSSLTKIIYQLKNQLERKRPLSRSGESTNRPNNELEATTRSSIHDLSRRQPTGALEMKSSSPSGESIHHSNSRSDSGKLEDESKSTNRTATITFEIIGEPLTESQQEQQQQLKQQQIKQEDRQKRREDDPPTPDVRHVNQSMKNSVLEKQHEERISMPMIMVKSHKSATRLPKIAPNPIVLSRWQPATPKPPRIIQRNTDRLARNKKRLEEPNESAREIAGGLLDQLLSDDDSRFKSPSMTSSQASFWSRPLSVASPNGLITDKAGPNAAAAAATASLHEDALEYERMPLASMDDSSVTTNFRKPQNSKRQKLIEASGASMRANEHYASDGTDQSSHQMDDEDRASPLYQGHQVTGVALSNAQQSRLPSLAPNSIQLQQIYAPPAPPLPPLPPAPTSKMTDREPMNDISFHSTPTKTFVAPHYGDREQMAYARNHAGRPRLQPINSSAMHFVQSLSRDQSETSTNYQRQQQMMTPARTKLHQTLQQQQSQQSQQQHIAGPFRDLLDQPQTIQITAIPNNNVFASGILGGLTGVNGLGGVGNVVRINANGQFDNMWNTGGFLDPFGRPVMMVNAERRQLDWSFWIWPLIAIVTLPLIMSALFVPIFLKTIVIIIQILQSLGLLLPIANALGHHIGLATGAMSAGSTLAALAGSASSSNSINQLVAEHNQKEAGLVELRNVTEVTTILPPFASNATI